MPMEFRDMASLERAADVWKFRKLKEGETEIEYRTALADFIEGKDPIESMEIRTGKGWDEWSDSDKAASIMRAIRRNR